MSPLPSDALVLVTGANGFVGSRVCRHLTSRGTAVRALVRRADADLTEAGDVAVAVASLHDPDGLGDALVGVTHVVHCAATAGPDLEQATAANVVGTRDLLEAAAAASVERVVHVSTTSVVHDDEAEVDEHSRLVDDDASPYAVTKRDAEQVVAEVARDTELPVVVLRPPAVLGWGPTSTWGQKVPAWVAAGELPFHPDRRANLGWVHVDDFAAAVALALTADAAVGQTYVVANGTTTWGAFLDEVVAWFEDAPDPFTPAEEPPTPRAWSSTTIREELGWTPTHDMADAMAEAAVHHG
jgi:nucleoside-diphosphate-sugar epimerase